MLISISLFCFKIILIFNLIRGLQNFITLTGFTTRESILLRLLELDQLTEERKLGNVFLV